MKEDKFFIDILTLKGELIYRGYSESTCRIYISTVKEFLEYTDKEIIRIRKEDVIRYLDKQAEKLSKNTILIKLNALELFFEEILGLDITENIYKYKREYNNKIMSIKEIETLIALSKPRERLIYILMNETGIKSDEIKDIKVKDLKCIDNNNKWIIEAKNRKYNITTELARDMYNYIEKYRLKEEIFLSSKKIGLHGSVIKKKFREKTTELFGIKYGINEMRYGIALEMWKRGETEKVQEYLRNKSKQSIKQYLKRLGYNFD
ncbi:integrase [Fusobacterium sp. PH5-7]|uniref:phage integrase N-terminal SAM-like domain-containing protein n=1 Tax=Fusobacterium sp. PH5-7 TaxID=2940528 RepID=UPI002474CF70|nr:phage integrase N-terminal SAM-like domain-containing protein [Fusobacterium sp. PH5-7]MDH6457606.1 integrase [Fusobacterium sp. PH5-7]